VIRLII